MGGYKTQPGADVFKNSSKENAVVSCFWFLPNRILIYLLTNQKIIQIVEYNHHNILFDYTKIPK